MLIVVIQSSTKTNKLESKRTTPARGLNLHLIPGNVYRLQSAPIWYHLRQYLVDLLGNEHAQKVCRYVDRICDSEAVFDATRLLQDGEVSFSHFGMLELLENPSVNLHYALRYNSALYMGGTHPILIFVKTRNGLSTEPGILLVEVKSLKVIVFHTASSVAYRYRDLGKTSPNLQNVKF